MQKPALLVVEDHPALREAVAELLRIAFPAHAVLEAPGAAAAMAAVRAGPVALALIDVALGPDNGIDLTARLRAASPRTQVVVTSQHAPAVYEPRALQAGATAFVTKDRLYQDLLNIVARALATGGRDGA